MTDPLAFDIPHSSGSPIVMDMTTTVLSEGKVRVKRQRSEEGIFVEDETWRQICEWGARFGLGLGS